MLPPALLNFTALDNKFNKIRSIISGSNKTISSSSFVSNIKFTLLNFAYSVKESHTPSTKFIISALTGVNEVNPASIFV